MDLRYIKLAKILTDFSTKLKKGEKVFIDACDVPEAIVIALVRASRERKAVPFVQLHRARIDRELISQGVKAEYELASKIELQRMKQMNAYIALRGSDNIFELSDVSSDQMKLVSNLMKPILDWRVKKTKWVVLRWPTPAMAQQARQSTETFENFFFSVCTFDYSRMIPGMRALQQLIAKTDKVQIKGPQTDLRFSLKGMGAVACGGHHNIPDGEVFSCPRKTSVEGHITYNAPTVYQGISFDSVRLVFKKGRIVKATANNTEKLNHILNSDGGARYTGEFALGFNPHIRQPMRDILFDEKIAGSFHLTPGQAYEEVDNGNRSQVHWDLVCIQRPEYGGGEIYFDDRLIRKDGLFVPKSLQKLNPEHLLSQ